MALEGVGGGAATGGALGGPVGAAIGAGVGALASWLNSTPGTTQGFFDTLKKLGIVPQDAHVGTGYGPTRVPGEGSNNVAGFLSTNGGGSPGGIDISGLPPIGGGGSNLSLADWARILGIGTQVGIGATAPGTPAKAGTPSTTSGTSDWTKLAPQLIGLLGGLAGAGINSNAIQQAQDMLKAGADQFGGLGKQGFDLASPYLNQGADYSKSTLNGTNQWQQLINNALLPNVRTLNDALPGLMSQNFATESPQIMQALGQLQSNATGGPLNTMLERALQNVNNGGATADSRNQFQQYQAMQSGATPVMQDLANGGASLLNSGGMTPILQALAGSGTQSAASGGMTPEIANALKQVQGLLAGGGGTAATNALTQRGMDLAGREALAPMSLVLSGAEDQAGTRQAQAAERMRADAMARGGGPGATVANGVQNQALADFATQGAQGQAAAYQQALKDQQGLQLQQMGTGAQMAQGGQSLETQRLGELLNSISNLTATSTGRMNVGGNLALGASGNATQNMGVGGNLLNSFNQGSLGAGSLADAILTLEMGNQRGNMDLVNQGTGTQSSMLNSVIQQLMAGRTQGAQAGNNLGNLYLGNQSQLGNILANGQQSYQNANNSLQGAGGQFLNFSGNMFGDMGPLLTGTAAYAANSPWGKFVDDLSSATMGSGGLGDIFKTGSSTPKTPKQSGTPNTSYDPNGGLQGG